MAVVFIDGFDKYGPTGGTNPSAAGLLLSSEWNSTGGYNGSVAAPLSATGYGWQFSAGSHITKTLPDSYSRLIAGFRFSTALQDQTTLTLGPISFGITQTTGLIKFTGASTVYSTVSVSAFSIHYLECDVTFGTNTAYQVWLDGVSVLSGTMNMGGTSANTATFTASTYETNFVVDDFYLFDDTGTTNNAALLTNPRIETTFPDSDSQTQFTLGNGILGPASQTTNSVSSPGANKLFLRQYTPVVNCTLNSITCLPKGTSTGAYFAACVYDDSTGAPGSLLSGGTAVTGATTGTLLTSALSTSQNLTADTPYWLGFITDTSVNLGESDAASTIGQVATNTYSSGPPATAPTMTAAQPNWMIYGNLTNVAADWTQECLNPPVGDTCYMYSSTVGAEDLYHFTALSNVPTAIYAVGVKAYARRTDTGTRTLSLQTKSGTVDNAGSNSSITPPTTYGWCDSYFETDPNTTQPWTGSGLNAAVSGMKIAS